MDKLKRIGAALMAVALVGMFIATFIMGVSGSEYFMGMIFLDVVIPVICWGVWLIARVLKRKGQELRDEDAHGTAQDKNVH